MSGRRPENNDLNECAVRWPTFDPGVLGPTLSTRTARSCAFKCAFCDYPERAGGLTLADVSTVERELEDLARMGVRRVAFIDDTFNVPIRRFKELCRMMVRRDFGIEWFSYFRCGHAREPEVYELMHAAGCRGVLLGIESADDQVLLNMDKRATSDAYRHGIEQLKRLGIFIHASLVVGFPGETPDSVRRTVDFLDETAPDTFAVNHWYYLHSTPIRRRAAEFELQGEGYVWSHRTMTSDQAMEAADEIFASVRNAAWMPVNGLDFWGVPYLLGKGMTHAEVVRFLELAKPVTANRVARETARGGGASVAAAERSFKEFCSQLRLSDGRYRRTWSEVS
jgi:p-methyltransferase